jgi:predicted ArsR family transcriptional regulator
VKIPSEASRRVARSLLTHGPATAPELAQRLGMTPAGVRRHLDSLEADGLIQSGERPAFGPRPARGRGRPPRVYSVTEVGRDTFDQAYDDLAASALRFLAESGGSAAITAFAQRRAAELERRYLPLLAAETDPRRKAEVLANAMSDDGFVASVTHASGSASALQICQHNCPVAHVAGEFPELCTAEAEAMGRLLHTNVTRLATIAHGDGVCTAVVSVPDAARSHERIPS